MRPDPAQILEALLIMAMSGIILAITAWTVLQYGAAVIPFAILFGGISGLCFLAGLVELITSLRS